MISEDYKSNPYFFLTTKTGKQLLAKANPEKAGIEVIESDGKLLIHNYIGGNWIRLTEIFEIQLVRVAGEVKPIPVQYNQTATGADAMLVAKDSVETINVLDENCDAVKAMRAIDSGIIPVSGNVDVSQSSKIIHKFSGR